MNTTQTLQPKPGNRLWGIYHPDREYAREVGDPIRTVVEAPTKQAAARLSFRVPWAHPVTAAQAKQRQELTRQRTRGIRV
jgi:hypothetical protein